MVKMTSDIVKCTNLPVTVKTRLGWDDNTRNVQEVAERLQDIGIQALTVHGRTRVQMYKGSADWTLIGKIKENPRIRIPVFGNGDIDSPEKALEYKNRYGIDGIMIGRAAIGYPWIFNEIKHFFKTGEKLESPDIAERVRVTKKHLEFSIRWKGDRLGIFEMRRHYTNYFKGVYNFKPFRTRLVEADTDAEVRSILDEVSETYADCLIPI
jgi:nifR3 family TIM-barrel protein